MPHRHRQRRGFTLLEVMLAVGILAVSLMILVQTQATAAQATMEADRILMATQLAQEKLAEVRLFVEYEGFTDQDVWEEGEFDEFGDEALNLEFENLDRFHWEFLVTEVDLEMATDLTGAAGNLMGAMGGDAAQLPGGSIPDLSSLGLGEDFVANLLAPFVREVRVRVWWGEDLEEAEELGNEVVMTTHMINPSPNILALVGAAGGGGGPALGVGGGQPGIQPGAQPGARPGAQPGAQRPRTPPQRRTPPRAAPRPVTPRRR